MMGAESVGYHERTVLKRGDDQVANALDYYAFRGGDAHGVGRGRRRIARP